MDPLTILALSNTCLSIVTKLGSICSKLSEFGRKYQDAGIGIRSLSTQCNCFLFAINGIKAWKDSHEDLLTRFAEGYAVATLQDCLETSELVVGALEDAIASLLAAEPGTRRDLTYLWRSTALVEHEDRIRSLATMLSLLLQTLNLLVICSFLSHEADLPVFRISSPEQTHDILIRLKLTKLREESESVRSFVASDRSSYVSSTRRSSLSAGSPPELCYQARDFDEVLFTSDVYRRNYRTREMAEDARGMVDRRPRMRIRYRCHQCNTDWGGNRDGRRAICGTCQHRLCRSCRRYPLRAGNPQTTAQLVSNVSVDLLPEPSAALDGQVAPQQSEHA